MSLTTARNKRKEAREQVAAGIDPADIKKAQKNATAGSAANSFEVTTREWHADQLAAKSWSKNHAEQKLQKLENELIGSFLPEDFKPLQNEEVNDYKETTGNDLPARVLWITKQLEPLYCDPDKKPLHKKPLDKMQKAFTTLAANKKDNLYEKHPRIQH